MLQTDTFNTPATLGATDSVKVNGINGGAQAGYNWQMGNFLLGLETDIQASGERGTNTLNGFLGAATNGSAAGQPAVITDSNKLEWFGTTRGRFGWASDRWLVYGTGGVAYGEVNQNGNINPPTPTIVAGQNALIVWNQSTTKVGWAAGVGVENAITRNWSWKLEYLYMDLGTSTANLSGGVGTVPTLTTPGNCYGSAGGCSFYRNPASGTITSHFTDNIVRLGVNYRLN
jgi:outer membrane immunogenic protein